MEKLKKYLVVAAMALTLVGIFAAHVILPDGEFSSAERRKLAQLPELTMKDVFSGDYFDDLETYLLDQFPLRDGFRRLKANFQYKVLGMQDNNDLYYVDGEYLMFDLNDELGLRAYAPQKYLRELKEEINGREARMYVLTNETEITYMDVEREFVSSSVYFDHKQFFWLGFTTYYVHSEG